MDEAKDNQPSGDEDFTDWTDPTPEQQREAAEFVRERDERPNRHIERVGKEWGIAASAEKLKPDPYDATKCDMCGQRKQSVRQRTAITIGLETGTVRTKFCDECAATVTKWSPPKDEEDNNQQRL